MTAAATGRYEPWLWAAGAVLVLGLHAGAAAMLFTWHDPVNFGDGGNVVYLDLVTETPPSDTVDDIAPGPLQQEAAPAPPPDKPKVEDKVDERVDVPPAPVPPVAALPPEPIKSEPPTPVPVAPAPATTAPPRPHPSPAQIKKWYSSVAMQIERHKSYPASAQRRGETGVVELAFSIDREGHVLSSKIVKSSGYKALDEETLATVRRAQPFPVPPADMDGDKFNFNVPVRFKTR
ncbi:MAG TPA: energy transducer TonB [Xanthobacteraceae bacterium]|nr:energy transducer TonB [Xanthobacteraceae bacterium]